jgi:uncharacterized phage protein gp47/JayE
VLSDTLSTEVIGVREEQISSYYADQLSNARGKALDYIGEKLGCFRNKAQHANVDSTERSLAFFVESGTFGSINGGSNINLVGSVISSDANTNELNTSVSYVLTEPLTLLAAGTLQYATARAINLGSASNVGTGVLRQHNFTNYVGVQSNTLKVLNFYPVLNGLDEEPDDLYRFRIANHYNRILTNNDTRMKLTALDIPGVVNSRVEPGYFGIGTAGVLALGPENQANSRLINSLQERLDSWRLPGGQYIAAPATQVEFDFEIEVNPARPLTNTQIVRLKAEINKAFLDYFRQLTIGAVVDLKLMSTATQKRMVTVASFANRNGDRNRIFKRVYVRKSYAGAASDERSRVATGTYALARDEFAALGSLVIEVL